MTISTLKYIHQLLTENEKALHEAYSQSREYLEDLRERGESKRQISGAKADCKIAEDVWLEACRALNEFNDHDFR